MSFLRAFIISWCAYTSKAVVCNPNETLITETGEPFETSICGTVCGNINFLRLQLSHIDENPKETTEIVIAYAETATEYFDGNWDAWYLRPPDAYLSGFNRVMLASIIEKISEAQPQPSLLSINRYSTSVLNASHTVPLYHFAGKSEQYTMTMTEMENYPGDFTVILRDNNATEEWEKTTHLLNTGPYTFLGDPTDNSNDWAGSPGELGSDRFELIIVPTIDGYASCQFNCGAAESELKCNENAYQAGGCKWLTGDDWPDLTNPEGECINLSFIPGDCSDAVNKNGKPSSWKCTKKFPYSAKCQWAPTATQPMGECLALDEEYTPLTCDMALQEGKNKPSKKKCRSKPFKNINCEWAPIATQPKGECLAPGEEFTPLTCDLAVQGKKNKPSKKKCLSKPFKKINCEWKGPPDQPEKECVVKS